MTTHPNDRDWGRLDALVDEDPIALRDAAWRLTTALAAEEAELDSWMTRAYEAEKRAWQAEKRIKAARDVIDDVDGDYDSHGAHRLWVTRRIRRALESVPPPSA